jgi:DNA-binding transcriptional MerR regulator
MYTIKDVAKSLCVTEHTLRYYTDQELIPTIKRDKNNNRVFDEESLAWLRLIVCLRGCGMAIKSIKKYIDLYLVGDSTLNERYEIIKRQEKIAAEEYKKSKDRFDFIQKKKKYYENLINNNLSEGSILSFDKK